MCNAGGGVVELVNALTRGDNIEAREKVVVGQHYYAFYSADFLAKEALSDCCWGFILHEGLRTFTGLAWVGTEVYIEAERTIR